MSKPIFEPDPETKIATNKFGVKDLKFRPFTGRWYEPNCCDGFEPDCSDAGTDCDGDEPPLQNDWAQPSPPLETFAFRLHKDGSLEFRGHLDTSQGAVSGTVAVTLPGAVDDEIDFRLANDQYWHTTITTDDGATFFLALVFIEAITGDVTITWPVS